MSEADKARPRRSRAKPLDLHNQSLAVDLILREGLSMDEAVARVRARVLRSDAEPTGKPTAPPGRARWA